MTAPIAFYAPLKSPAHPAPSGDRTMARLLIAALRRAGFAPELVSELRTFEPSGDETRQLALREAGLAEAERLVHALEARPRGRRPQLWFTYHSYYKAPDWTGPAAASALGIPYVLAEASWAGKRAFGPWAVGHAGAGLALARANAVFVITARDRVALSRDTPAGQRLVDLPPFLDADRWPVPGPSDPGSGSLRLLAVAMMRESDKLASYRQLAAALRHADGLCGTPPWSLAVVGDGPAREKVESLLAPFGDRVAFHGRVDEPARLAAIYEAADLLVWPAVNEAYGMALLEAQAMGCPVLAGRQGGVENAMAESRTGVLAPPDDPAAFARAMLALAADRPRLHAMRSEATRFVREERNLAGAARILRRTLADILPRSLAA